MRTWSQSQSAETSWLQPSATPDVLVECSIVSWADHCEIMMSTRTSAVPLSNSCERLGSEDSAIPRTARTLQSRNFST